MSNEHARAERGPRRRKRAERVFLECVTHGTFTVTRGTADEGAVCPDCRAEIKRREREASFIERAARRWPEYDYSQVNYRDGDTPVTVVCLEHGPFRRTVGEHFQKSGCPTCSREAQARAARLDLAVFIERSQSVHGDRYDYSLVEYQGTADPVSIICKRHGVFLQRPAGHLQGNGCRTCENEAKIGRHVKPMSAFIERCRVVHGDKYDYSLVAYSHLRDMVRIICPTHGEFQQEAASHQRGYGCQQCRESKGERLIASLLDAASIAYKREWMHPTLRYRGPLRFDFAIEAISVAIEFDGDFHRAPKPYGVGSLDSRLAEFRAQVERDRAKDRWAQDNSWLLLRVHDTAGVLNVVDYVKRLLNPKP